ncbi:Farnesyl pyrophosphate synthase [Fusarium oxysporum f. sp. albedinis]|nr:Farnesyl pyrophosphate synthase [Fusarium oxysporum f. sp. albedinis]
MLGTESTIGGNGGPISSNEPNWIRDPRPLRKGVLSPLLAVLRYDQQSSSWVGDLSYDINEKNEKILGLLLLKYAWLPKSS